MKADPEAGLLDIVQRMQGAGEHFDYDASIYTSAPRHARSLDPYLYPYSSGYPYSYYGFYPYSYYGPGWWGRGY